MHISSAVRTAYGALEAVSLACRFAAILLLVLMASLVVGQVVGRNVFDLGMPWADELARFSGIALVFLCVPLLALRGQHVAVDLVPMMLPRRLRRYAFMLIETAILVFCLLTLYGFQSFLSRAGKFSSPAIGIPNWLFYAPALAGFVLLLLIAVVRLAGLFLESEPAPGDSAAS
ncbi:TRAP transporter small permease [Phyllobacterium phragmitis]|uniref:TRAP transporter small permease protein n=1 Tax=Phyllobacterium phragmitis TaxID=2670329 RepID=A0A2S9IW70_9HYPH|nr:TRAP transporter small permease [Phyllobacterium phragmitis]PRD44774.1 TRAP transporter small permease [Phyllobacterium phragmitis]